MSLRSRPYYLDQLVSWLWSPVIKVISGMRRVGKSSLLKSLMTYTTKNHIYTSEQIFYLNKELNRYDHIVDYTSLKKEFLHWKETNSIGDHFFVALDEIQQVVQREKFVTWLLAEYHDSIDIYITWSNSFLLSSELATFLTWRYLEYKIYPLTYSEYLSFGEQEHSIELFWQYIEQWGMPGIWDLKDASTIPSYVSTIYDSIIVKDVLPRHQIRNVEFFHILYKYVAANIWNIFSAKSIKNYLKAQELSVKVETILQYLSYGQEAFVLHKVLSQDPIKKKFFQIHNKYYVGDIWMRNALSGFDRLNHMWWLLENYVYLLLLKHRYEVRIGRWKNWKEIDFIASRQGKMIYIQVSYLLNHPETVEREYGNLRDIRDNRPKYVVTMDPYPLWVKDWCEHVQVWDFEEHVV